jgi:uncharacterized membrane protein
MGISSRFRQWPFDKRRLEAFSDGVFAIVMTILVLDLKLPHIAHPERAEEIWNALVAVRPVFFSWVVSFFFVALIWIHHHQILKMSVSSDYGTTWINTILLFLICLLPFPTAMMGEYPLSVVVVMLWGLVFSATTFVLTWFYYYNAKYHLSDKYDKVTTMKNVRFSILGGPAIYLIAALLANASVYISYVLYALVPLLYLLPLDKERSGVPSGDECEP